VKAFKVRNELLIFVYLPFSLSRYFQVTSYLKSGILIDYAGIEPGARARFVRNPGDMIRLWQKTSTGAGIKHLRAS
jgi:hypothetical protein